MSEDDGVVVVPANPVKHSFCTDVDKQDPSITYHPLKARGAAGASPS